MGSKYWQWSNMAMSIRIFLWFRLVIHFGKYISTDFSIFLSNIEQRWPWKIMIEIILEHIIFWQAPKITVLNLMKILKSSSSNCWHLLILWILNNKIIEVNNHFYLNAYWMTNMFWSRLFVFFYFSTCGLLFPLIFLFLICPFFKELPVFNGLYDVYVSVFGVRGFNVCFTVFSSSFSTYIVSFWVFSIFFPYSIMNFVNTVSFSLASAKLDSFA